MLQDGEMTTAPPCSRDFPKKPDYLFRVTLGLHPDLDADQTVTLTLPASAEELKKAQKQLDADGWEGVVVLAYDGIIPQAAEFADLPAELETFNHFAEVVENMPSREKQLPKFKAVLRICQCSSVDQAISLAERLEHFYFDARIRNYADLVYDELENVIGDRQAEELRQCLDIEKYGRILQQGYNAVFTEYGMVTRDDFQPMDAPWQDESEVMDIDNQTDASLIFYNPDNWGEQRILAYSYSIEKDAATGSVEVVTPKPELPKSARLAIRKVDADTGAAMPGVTFALYNAAGVTAAYGTTNEDGYVYRTAQKKRRRPRRL